MSDHKGHSSMLADIEKDLLNFIEEWHQKGFDVNRFTLLRKAGQLKPAVVEGRSNFAVKICLSPASWQNTDLPIVLLHTRRSATLAKLRERRLIFWSTFALDLLMVPVIPTSSSTWIRLRSTMETGFHPVWNTILHSCMKNYFFECLTSILEKFSYLRYHTLVYEKSQSSPPSLMALIASSPGSEHM